MNVDYMLSERTAIECWENIHCIVHKKTFAVNYNLYSDEDDEVSLSVLSFNSQSFCRFNYPFPFLVFIDHIYSVYQMILI